MNSFLWLPLFSLLLIQFLFFNVEGQGAEQTAANPNQAINDKWYGNPTRSACDRDYSCFSDPADCQFRPNQTKNVDNELCSSFILYRQNPGNTNLIDFYLERRDLGADDTDKFIALGLGTSPEMGGSSVIMCFASSEPDGKIKFDIVNRYNLGYKNIELNMNDSRLGLIEYNAGFISDNLVPNKKNLACRFSRDKMAGNEKVFKLATVDSSSLTPTTGGEPPTKVKRQETEPIPSKYFLMLAQGNMKNGIPQYHAARAPHVSNQEIALTQSLRRSGVGGPVITPTVVSRPQVGLLTRVHGILMIIAWLFFVTFATLNARHLKQFCPQRTFCGGLKYWFVIHRSFNYLAVIIIIISTIIIFVKAKRWSPFVHSVTGILAVILAVIQPIMAYFRPHPGTTTRLYFNWLHRTVGVIALLLAYTSIFLATKFPGLVRNAHIQVLFKIMVAFVVLYGITEIILFSMRFIRGWLKRRRMSKNKNSYDLTRYSNNANPIQTTNLQIPANETKINKKWDITKFLIVHIFGLITLALVIAMCVFLGRA